MAKKKVTKEKEEKALDADEQCEACNNPACQPKVRKINGYCLHDENYQ